MGLSNFPSASEGVVPVIVMNTAMSVAILKNLVLKVVGYINSEEINEESKSGSVKGISITQYKHLLAASNYSYSTTTMECCVCLCKFGEEEEVSQLTCKHFFHTDCLDKWFHNHRTTCPLCRSIHSNSIQL